jgi:hypothetical protein
MARGFQMLEETAEFHRPGGKVFPVEAPVRVPSKEGIPTLPRYTSPHGESGSLWRDAMREVDQRGLGTAAAMQQNQGSGPAYSSANLFEVEACCVVHLPLTSVKPSYRTLWRSA